MFLRFPTAVKHDPAIDRWLSTRREALRPLVETWFGRMRRCGSDVRELMHDGCPTACVGDAAFGYVATFTEHMNVGFFFGAMLDDRARLLEGTGKRGRHVKLRPAREVDVAALARLVEAAYADVCARLRIAKDGRRTGPEGSARRRAEPGLRERPGSKRRVPAVRVRERACAKGHARSPRSS